ncbi:hypothetical protein EMN47_06505 [Prolixibacteraceae bacterium JC049]|nr:hypothetical protein [Prolixibacteraceae bacterium JC049]
MRSCSSYNNKCRKYPFFGIFLVIVGLLLVGQEMGYLSDSVISFLMTWKMLLVAIGVVSLFNGNRTGGFILIFIGGFFMLPDFIDVPQEIEKLYWPIGLISLGGIMILRNRIRTKQVDYNYQGNSNQFFEDFVIFGGREQLLSSDQFRGARTTSIFGGLEYNLTRCKISPEGAVIDVFTLFGGTTFNLPPDWSVRNELTTVFGGLSDERMKNPALHPSPDKVVVIRGLCLFGGIEIESKNYPVG